MGKRKPASSRHHSRRRRNRFWWAELDDARLMEVRLCDLGVRLDGTPLAERVAQLHEELAERKLRLRPHCWLSHEWFAPDGVPGIAIPFFLAHPRLQRLEDRQMLSVEGGTKTWCMQLLRHEAGHNMEVAYRLNRRAKWRRMFGRSTKRYPETYKPDPFSRKHVLHLDGWYAQSHPSEDFAETFAVWLLPGSNWRKRYQGWPALKKLQYVDELMRELAGQAPVVRSRERLDPLSEQRMTLGQYYRQRKAQYEADYPEIYDRDLRRVFPESPDGAPGWRAVTVMRRIAPAVRRHVAAFTGEYPYAVDQLLKDMSARCRELDLRVHRPLEEIKVDVAVLLTMQVTNYLHRGGRRLAL